MRFRLAEVDHERYGDQWFTFDEADLTRLPARELMALDDALKTLGLNVVAALESYSTGEMRGSLAVMWMARRLAGIDESLDDFDPLPLAAEAQIVREGDADPPAQTPSTGPSTE